MPSHPDTLAVLPLDVFAAAIPVDPRYSRRPYVGH
jgi:hypothetical protein